MGRWMQKISKEGHTSTTKPAKPSSVGFVSSLSPQQTKKQATNDSLNQQKVIWLVSVAGLLGCSPTYLQEHGFIDDNDLIEQCSTAPRLAARLVRSHPDWTTMATLPSHQMPADRSDDLSIHLHHTATISPSWCQAHDLYLQHLMTCRSCYAPTSHYCAAGAELRNRYNTAP